MNRFVTLLTIVALSVLMARCSSKKTASNTKSPEEIVADVKKNFTEAQMQEGMTIFQGHCGKCHAIKEPETHTVDKWEKILPRMSQKANLDKPQSDKVRAYVLAHAKM
ncbi:MAG: hypothetical protein H6550_08300 [Chitinophagales bacterium]|nr:hypothetical protein [Chitinophagales bacterium]